MFTLGTLQGMMLLPVEVLPVEPNIGGAIGGEGEGEGLGNGRDDLCIGPGRKVVAGVIEARQVGVVVILAAHDLPGQRVGVTVGVLYLELAPLCRIERVEGRGAIVGACDLCLKIAAPIFFQVAHRGLDGAGHQPGLHIAILKLVLEFANVCAGSICAFGWLVPKLLTHIARIAPCGRFLPRGRAGLACRIRPQLPCDSAGGRGSRKECCRDRVRCRGWR